MSKHLPVKAVLTRYAGPLQEALQSQIAQQRVRSLTPETHLHPLETMYGQLSYHLGWVDRTFSPVLHHTGKLLRPTLLLLAYEAAGTSGLAKERKGHSHLHCALPAAVALELFHNFTLTHDDIEDRDRERRHRPTLWSLWGIPFGINTGDALHCFAHLALLNLLQVGIDARLVAELGGLFDWTALQVIEGQHLDLSFEAMEQVTLPLYLEMIQKKTAELMACATEMGARLATSNTEIIDGLRHVGLQPGLVFQIRDDLLGIWATRAVSGKLPASDLIRRKKTLPILHALQHAKAHDHTFLHAFYRGKQIPDRSHVEQVLQILESLGSRTYCQHALAERCQLARNALEKMPLAQEAKEALFTLIAYVEEDLS